MNKAPCLHDNISMIHFLLVLYVVINIMTSVFAFDKTLEYVVLAAKAIFHSYIILNICIYFAMLFTGDVLGICILRASSAYWVVYHYVLRCSHEHL